MGRRDWSLLRSEALLQVRARSIKAAKGTFGYSRTFRSFVLGSYRTMQVHVISRDLDHTARLCYR